MAAKKSKKKASKSSSRAKKKTSSARSGTKKAAGRRRASAERVLDDGERLRLLKPRGEYDKIVEKIVSELDAKTVKVAGLTSSKLSRLLSAAEKARQKENDLRTKQEIALRRLSDKRLLAEHALWDAVLEVNATVKLAARRRPEVADRFGFLTDALRGDRSASERREPAVEPTT